MRSVSSHMLSAERSNGGSNPVVVFIPVSGASGAGEYYRCLAAATALHQHGQYEIHFLISQEAAVERDPRFHYHVLERSPTLETRPVVEILQRLRPAVTVFDSTFRTAQLRAAKRLGSSVVCLASRRAKRRKLLLPHKLRYVDAVYIVGETDPAHQKLSGLERIVSLGWEGHIHFGGAVLPHPDASCGGLPEALAGKGYIVVAPGGGGGTVAGTPAMTLFSDVARTLVERFGIPVYFIPGPLSEGAITDLPGLHTARSLPPSELARAMEQATACILGGGSILLQGLALGQPCIGVPAGGKDQPARIGSLAGYGLTLEPEELTPESIAATAGTLWQDGSLREALVARVRESGFRDASTQIANDISSLARKHDCSANFQ